MEEIELKFLDVNPEEIKGKLREIGAKEMYSADTESYEFLAQGFSPRDSDKKYLRVRRVNDNVTLTYKDPRDPTSNMTSRKEIETEVKDYNKTLEIIEKLGFTRGKIFKKHRTHYELGEISFELDTLENIPTYLEIETQSEEDMVKACDMLELDINEGKKGTIVEILPEKFE